LGNWFIENYFSYLDLKLVKPTAIISDNFDSNTKFYDPINKIMSSTFMSESTYLKLKRRNNKIKRLKVDFKELKILD
jgi:hypothetical protein